jgi:hypothetical protein
MKAAHWCRLAVAMSSTLWSITAAAAPELQLKGTLYKLGSNRQEKLYTWDMKICPNVWTSNYYRLDGKLAVQDTTRFNGQRFAEYSYVRYTIGEKASVKVKGRQLEFKHERDGETQSETLTTSDVFLTGPAVFAFIQQHLKELQGGAEFEFKYGVLDRLDYFTFELSRDGKAGGETSRIKISATSLFVRMAVSPIYVTLSKDGKFRGITGRSIVIEKDGKQFRPIDADLVVESETPASCGPPPLPAQR